MAASHQPKDRTGYFNKRWKGWVEHAIQEAQNTSKSWAANMCGQCKNISVTQAYRETVIPAADGENANPNETAHGDKAMNRWEYNYILGRFYFAADVRIEARCSSVSYRTTIRVMDGKGVDRSDGVKGTILLGASAMFLLPLQYNTPDKQIGSWTISGSISCPQQGQCTEIATEGAINGQDKEHRLGKKHG